MSMRVWSLAIAEISVGNPGRPKMKRTYAVKPVVVELHHDVSQQVR
jgi:hypothetical protein